MVTGNRVCFPQPDNAVFPGFGGLYLRRHKVCCVAGSHEQSVLCSQLLGKPKVTDADRFGVSRLVHVQDVTGFQVPMNNLEGRKQQSRQSGREKERMRETRATWELIPRVGSLVGEKYCALLRGHPISHPCWSLMAKDPQSPPSYRRTI